MVKEYDVVTRFGTKYAQVKGLFSPFYVKSRSPGTVEKGLVAIKGFWMVLLANTNFSDGITRPDGGNGFYIKDHLGSTRAIMNKNGDDGWLLLEAMAYPVAAQ